MEVQRFEDYRKKVMESCEKVILGKEDSIFLVLVCFICSGHVLIEDVPGTGKTMLLRSFSKTVGGDFKRIQFTPDLLPSDLTGINFYNQKTGEFELRKGPLFANIVLADEINRATPRTQSSLLEAMEERQITIDGTTHMLSEPFMVMATQNPLESYGTFPLPDAQVDRFFMRISMGYMKRAQEMEVISRPSTLDIVESLEKAVSYEETEYVRKNFQNVKVSEDITKYIMDIIEGTRKENSFISGISTRGAIALYKASQATAALRGRNYVIPEDVRYVAPYVLTHRLSMGGGVMSSGRAEDTLMKIIDKVKVPMEDLA